MAKFFKRPKPVVLIIMDGVGVAAPSEGNAVTLANTPNLDQLWPHYPHTYLEASGLNVGLPQGTDGNSEVGHIILGAGKVVFQNLPRIDNSINNGSFFKNPMVKEAFDHAKKNNSVVHVMGLVGTGFVHASVEHLYAIIKMAGEENIKSDKLAIHIFTDGRDSSADAAVDCIEKVEAICIQRRVGKIASIIGRAYSMDRNRNWARTKIAYDMLVNGKGQKTKDWRKSIKDSYAKKITDEYLDPLLIDYDGEVYNIEDGDSIIFFNYRPDRAVQLTTTFEDHEFKEFPITKYNDLYFVGMTDYENGHPKNKAFPPEKVLNPLGKILSESGLKQLRLAESEKFPHVTYFFNGANKDIYPLETWLEVPSPKDVATYDKKPEMSQRWITEVLLDKLKTDEFDFMLVNFAGPDMVAHTGVIDATKIAMQVCDECVGKIVEAVLKKDGAIVITADHGNAEELIDKRTGNPDTKHSTNQVPILVVKNDLQGRELTVGGLSDVAPTLLSLLGMEIPADMTGRDLLS